MTGGQALSIAFQPCPQLLHGSQCQGEIELEWWAARPGRHGPVGWKDPGIFKEILRMPLHLEDDTGQTLQNMRALRMQPQCGTDMGSKLAFPGTR